MTFLVSELGNWDWIAMDVLAQSCDCGSVRGLNVVDRDGGDFVAFELVNICCQLANTENGIFACNESEDVFGTVYGSGGVSVFANAPTFKGCFVFESGV